MFDFSLFFDYLAFVRQVNANRRGSEGVSVPAHFNTEVALTLTIAGLSPEPPSPADQERVCMVIIHDCGGLPALVDSFVRLGHRMDMMGALSWLSDDLVDRDISGSL